MFGLYCSYLNYCCIRIFIFPLFGRASGVQVNFAKSTATLIRNEADAATHVVELLGCPIVLGIPLTLWRPSAAQLQPVVDKTALMLPCWKAHLMSKASRLAFVKAILGVIPIHRLLVLATPKKTLKALEKIQRGFLWAGRAEANGGHCHVNWQRVARPIVVLASATLHAPASQTPLEHGRA